MSGAAVTLVLRQPVAGELAVQLNQQPVAVNLGQNACSGDGEAGCIASNHGLLRALPLDGVAAVNEQKVRAERQSLDGATHGQQRRLANIDAVNGFSVHGGDGPGKQRVRANLAGRSSLRFFLRELLGVSQARQREKPRKAK
jgi:hypothetical protein